MISQRNHFGFYVILLLFDCFVHNFVIIFFLVYVCCFCLFLQSVLEMLRVIVIELCFSGTWKRMMHFISSHMINCCAEMDSVGVCLHHLSYMRTAMIDCDKFEVKLKILNITKFSLQPTMFSLHETFNL